MRSIGPFSTDFCCVQNVTASNLINVAKASSHRTQKEYLFCFIKKLKVLKWAEFLLETNYPSETDKSSRYKSGVQTNFGTKFGCTWFRQNSSKRQIYISAIYPSLVEIRPMSLLQDHLLPGKDLYLHTETWSTTACFFTDFFSDRVSEACLHGENLSPHLSPDMSFAFGLSWR